VPRGPRYCGLVRRIKAMKAENVVYKSTVSLPLKTAFILLWTILRGKIFENPENWNSGGGSEGAMVTLK
jgi:hypothetical protein